jgi:hypothetical protein
LAQCLLDQGGTVTLDADVSNGYDIDHTLSLSQPGATLARASNVGETSLTVDLSTTYFGVSGFPHIHWHKTQQRPLSAQATKTNQQDSNDLDFEIQIAAQSSVPVLITAPPEQALAVARDIGARGRSGNALPVLICDPAGGDDVIAAVKEEGPETLPADAVGILVVREVHALTETEQAELMTLLDDRQVRRSGRNRRIVATSSVSLFDRVVQGTFDARLFYRLNTIHIVPASAGESGGPSES